MELKQAIEKRTSIRKFTDEPVPIDDLKEMVRCAGMAPSVNNSQPWKFIVITNQNILQAMVRAVQIKIDTLFPNTAGKEAALKTTLNSYSTIFVNAPAVIAIAASPYEAVADKLLASSFLTHDDLNDLRSYPDIQSIGASVQNILLAAVDMGYGACWLSGLLVAREELEKLLKIEDSWKLVTFVAVGKPTGQPKPKDKKSLDEIFSLVE
ncbi:MAG TPA: nitroreductase family protein [bacterium]|nr:nitroreductase family protein [bacterium]HPN45192.1 nitroreductase family protein [bacterium]